MQLSCACENHAAVSQECGPAHWPMRWHCVGLSCSSNSESRALHGAWDVLVLLLLLLRWQRCCCACLWQCTHRSMPPRHTSCS